MTEQRQNRTMQTQTRAQGTGSKMQNRSSTGQGEPEVYTSYSYGYGYYDPFTGDWVMNYYGPFTGVGPTNYRRSDDRIKEDINDLFWMNGQLDASDIEIVVKEGEATLKGTVPDRQMKRLAEDLAYSVPGVSDVQNQLRIQQSHGHPAQGGNFKSQLKPGMQVVGSQGKKLGTVKEVHDFDFLIDRPSGPDLHAPFNSIQNLTNGEVHLNLSADQIDKMHWATSAK